jgi:type I restriction enzyme S subunit
MDGPITKQGIKIAFLTHHDVPALLLQRVCRFDPVGSVEKRFLYHILHSEDFLNHLDKSNRSIAIPHVSPGQLKSFQIPVLSSNQQIAICNFLDSVLIGDLSKSWPPLPQSLAEQQHTVAKLGELAIKIKEANKLKIEIDKASHQLLRGVFDQMTKNAKLLSMSEVAPITRRPVKVDLFSEYPELGIRSFGNGTFHKIPLSGAAVGNKRLFRIKPGDLVFNNVFAWEGAVAVAKGEDFGRFGSHRFITCVPQKGLSTPEFLCFYFLTNEGLEKMGQASPGGAGRNRTLGLEALSEIEVPVPPIEHQIWFGLLQAKVESLKKHQDQTLAELDGLMRSILDKAFKGEL